VAIYAHLTRKQKLQQQQQQQTSKKTKEQQSPPPVFKASTMERLAKWNGFRRLDASQIVLSGRRRDVGQGLIAEASPFALENYIVLARPSSLSSRQTKPFQEHPFVEQDFSLYRTVESKINDRLDEWEENSRKRRQERLHSAKESLQRFLDVALQVPLSKAWGVLTNVVGPMVERGRWYYKRGLVGGIVESMQTAATTTKDQDSKTQSSQQKQPMDPASKQSPPTEPTPETAAIAAPSDQEPVTCMDESKKDDCNADATLAQRDPPNLTDPEDLVILTKDGKTLLLLSHVDPMDRLLALPMVNTSVPTGVRRSTLQPPYRIRLARGGLIITMSLISLGAIAPTYRSLKFILEYPRTAEIVMLTLVGSVAYSLYSWQANAKTRQRELIASAMQARLVAQNQAAMSFLTQGAVEHLTDRLMEDYITHLLLDTNRYTPPTHTHDDPLLVQDIGLALGLFRREKPVSLIPSLSSFHEKDGKTKKTKTADGTIVAVEWEKARAELVHSLAVRM